MRSKKSNRTKKGFVAFVFFCVAIAAPAIFIASQLRQDQQDQLDRALIEAIKQSDANTVLTLLNRGANANAVDKEEGAISPFLRLQRLWGNLLGRTTAAAESDYTPAILVPYSDPSMADLRHPAGCLPPEENAALIMALLNHHANPYVRAADGKTILYIASFYGQHDTVAELLKHGMEPDVKDDLGRTPLMVADAHTSGHTALEDTRCAALLLEHGANPNARDNVGAGPLMYADFRGHIKLLLKYHANINAQDYHGKTALIQAITSSDDPESARFLIKNGAKMEIKDKLGKSALDYVKADHDTTLMRLLTSAHRIRPDRPVRRSHKLSPAAHIHIKRSWCMNSSLRFIR